jgi:hypothetical protein
MRSCLLIKPKNQLLPLILILDFKCRIRLDNLEFRKISRDFSNFLGPPPLFNGLDLLLGKLEGFFFLIFILHATLMCFLHFEALQREYVLFLLKFLLCKMCSSCLSYLLF